MHSYLFNIWNSRFFWMSLVRTDLRTRYRRSLLGVGWSLLQPLAMTAILCLVFHHFLGADVRDYVPHLLTGLVGWSFILTCANQGCQCFFLGESYIRQCPLPLAIYPLRTALGATFHLVMGLIVLIAVCLALRGPMSAPAMLSLVPSLVLIFLLGWSLAVLFGSANVFFQDTQHLTEVGFQLLFYMTPIIYRVEDLSSHPLLWVLSWNPVVPFLDLIRRPLIHSAAPDAMTYLAAVVVAGCLAAAASYVLSRLQDRLIFHL